MIASENFTWPSVMEACGSVATNKAVEGYVGKRYYGGCEFMDGIEELAIARAKALFGAEHANVQPHSGSQTNMAVLYAMLEPGDTFTSLRLDHGGHLSQGLRTNVSGRFFDAVGYGVDSTTHLIDYEELHSRAVELRPKLIARGPSAYPRVVDLQRLRGIADEVGAYLLFDMAHVAGLIAAGLYPNPVDICDVVTTTVQKTLAGPSGGVILCRSEHADRIDRAVFPGVQASALCAIVAAKATALHIAGTQAFVDYQRQIVQNARAFASRLTSHGLTLLTGGTDTHLLVVDLSDSDWTGRALEERLDTLGITVNRNAIPDDPRPRPCRPASGSAPPPQPCAGSGRTLSLRWPTSSLRLWRLTLLLTSCQSGLRCCATPTHSTTGWHRTSPRHVARKSLR